MDISQANNIQAITVSNDTKIDEFFVNSRYDDTVMKISYWLLKKALFLNNFDIFKIYKIDFRQKSQIYKSLGFNLESTKWDRRRENLSRLIIVLLTYFLIKASIINIVHYILHKEVDRSLLNSNPNCPNWWPECETNLENLLSFLGDPLAELSGESIFFTGGLSCCLYLVLAIMPHYYTKHSLDLACLRFFYDPGREIHRLNTAIELKFIQLQMGSRPVYRIPQHKKFNYYLASGLNLGNRQINAIHLNSRSNEQFSVQVIGDKRVKGFDLMRPDCFNETNRIRATKELAWIVFGHYFLFSWWILALIVPLIYLATKTRCKLLKLTHCNIWIAFNLPESIYIIEIIVACLLIYVSFVLHMVIVFILFRGNSRLVVGMRGDLEKCLTILKRTNETAAIAQPPDRLTRLTEVEPMDKILLEVPIKILVAAEELKSGTKSMSQLLAPIFASSFVVTALSIIVNGMSTQSFRTFKRQILFTYWVLINAYAMLNASISSQFCQLERLYWSIQAELLLRNNNRPIRIGTNDFISVVWRRLAFYSRSTKYQHTAKPLGIDLTYKKIIELNFSIVSLVSFSLLSNSG